jgi:hypothetical protein
MVNILFNNSLVMEFADDGDLYQKITQNKSRGKSFPEN